MNTCIVEGCQQPHTAKGMCHNHYYRYRRNGDFAYRKGKIIGPHPKCAISACMNAALTFKRSLCVAHRCKIKTYGDPLGHADIGTKVGRHEAGVRRVCELLAIQSVQPQAIPHPKYGEVAPFDILVNGDWKIEYKTSVGAMNRNGKYSYKYISFNLHRHNIPFDAGKTDFLWMRDESGQRDYIVPSAPFHGQYTVHVGKKLRRFNLGLAEVVAILKINRRK